ncbi:MAG: DUF885 family protein [Planctomycetota bacterium]
MLRRHSSNPRPIPEYSELGSILKSICLLLTLPILGPALLSAPQVACGQSNPVKDYIQQYSADTKTLQHRYRLALDEKAHQKRLENAQGWTKRLEETSFESLSRVGKIDYLLLKSELEYRIDKLQLDWQRDLLAQKWLPYSDDLLPILRDRENVKVIDAEALAERFDNLATVIEKSTKELKPVDKSDSSEEATRKRLEALRASELVQRIGVSVREADGFYKGYDPLYSWWTKKPVERLFVALNNHKTALRNKVVGVPESDKETIIGLPIGADGLALELKHEWISHSPAELVELAKREMTWCDSQMAQASKDLGFGDDWRAAMEHTKSKHVQPGEQPAMIRNLAWEAIRFLEANDLVTVPPLAANGWRMTMMSPERQKVSPYFLGGDSIIVSFPTDMMTHDEKLMSMRSNNEHFSRATVHHELIPGHHLQYYMLPRNRPYRSLFRTPFWMEGWALYWEMLLWDLEFAKSAEDRVGMLFWRKHRCARIIFSLSYHLGTMTPEQCIDYLVERVGHERSAATAEVRRSIMGGYSPLYQAAYMLGGLQLRAMHKELVQSGKMTNREFHDSILREHSIPIEALRLYMLGEQLSPDTKSNWRFADL